MSHRPHLLVQKHRRSVLGTAGLRRFDWARSPAAYLAGHSTAGARAKRLAIARLALSRSHITNNFGDSAPTARPQKTGAPVGSRLRFEWIADGCTALCFWTGTRRLIASLESGLWFSLSWPDSGKSGRRCARSSMRHSDGEDYINNKNYNYNLTSIIIREYVKTSNTDIFGMESVTSSLVLLLFKNKIKVLKSRFSNSNDKRIMNITSIVRKFKLQKLNQLL